MAAEGILECLYFLLTYLESALDADFAVPLKVLLWMTATAAPLTELMSVPSKRAILVSAVADIDPVVREDYMVFLLSLAEVLFPLNRLGILFRLKGCTAFIVKLCVLVCLAVLLA